MDKQSRAALIVCLGFFFLGVLVGVIGTSVDFDVTWR